MPPQFHDHLGQERGLRAVLIVGSTAIWHPAKAVDQIEHILNVVLGLFDASGGQQTHIGKIGVPIEQLLKNATDTGRAKRKRQTKQRTIIFGGRLDCLVPILFDKQLDSVHDFSLSCKM